MNWYIMIQSIEVHLSMVGVDRYFIVNRLNYFNICKQYYCIMSLKQKRTVAQEKRAFNWNWEFNYFMIETDTMMCVICGQVVKTA